MSAVYQTGGSATLTALIIITQPDRAIIGSHGVEYIVSKNLITRVITYGMDSVVIV